MATSTLGNGTLVLAGTTSGTTTVTATAVAGTTTLTLPAATDTLVGKATTDTLTNKTLTTPSVSSPTISDGTANGVAYLNGSKVLTTGSALTFDGSAFAVTGALSATTSITSIGSVGNVFTDSTGARLNFSRGADNYFQASTAGGYFAWIVNNSGSNAMTLDASGNLLVGTTSSNARITVKASGNAYSTGALALVGATSGTSYITNASGNLYFSNNGSTDHMILDSSGNLLVARTNATFYGGAVKLGVEQTSGAAWGFGVNANGNAIVFNHTANTSSGVGSITVTTSATAFNTSSDYRLKNTITPMTGALAKVAALKPVVYKWNFDGSDGEGFIAHELAEVCPHAVTGEKDAVDEEGTPRYQGVDTSFLVATLTAAIQEQQALITQLQADVAALKGA